jgi:hypothetical protein
VPPEAILTPTHIGSGEVLGAGEIVNAYGNFFCVDDDKLLARCADDADALAALDDPRLIVDEFLLKHNIPLAEVSAYEMKSMTRRVPRHGDPTLQFARQGVSQAPYVPGSSVKGALTSGLLWMINAEARDPDNPLWVSERFRKLLQECRRGPFPTDTKLRQELLGRDAGNQLMRVLRVPDATIADGGLRLYHSGLFHLAAPHGGYSWSEFRGGKVRDPRRAAPTFIEALQPGTIVPLRLEFDNFVLRAAQEKRVPVEFGAEAMNERWMSADYILSGAMDLAYNTLFQERQFFERAQEQTLTAATAELFDRCEGLNDNEVMLRLGWGINWHGVTGYLWDDHTAKELRLPQREKNEFPYPKSRRVVFEGETPIGTPGWMILRVKSRTASAIPAPIG